MVTRNPETSATLYINQTDYSSSKSLHKELEEDDNLQMTLLFQQQNTFIVVVCRTQKPDYKPCQLLLHI